jgi:tartrate-resistant acid phosphatase type 5
MDRSDLTRRRALGGLAGLGLTAALPLSRAWAQEGGGSLTFLAVGDWGREGAYHQRDVAIRMGESAREIDAHFVISVGDNFYEDGVSGPDDPAWQNSFEDVYVAPSLQVPWRVILGNHDYRGNSQAQLDYSARSSRWKLPARWYSFAEPAPDGSLAEFFAVDTSPMMSMYYADGAKTVKVGEQKQNVPLQLTWLDKALANSRADWKIVLGHHPVYSGKLLKETSATDPDKLTRLAGGSPDLMGQLDPILQRHRVPLYLNGHDHNLAHVFHGSTHFVCTGAGSKLADHCDLNGSDFCALRSGFIACAVNRNRLRVAYRDYTGAQLHVVDIPRPM